MERYIQRHEFPCPPTATITVFEFQKHKDSQKGGKEQSVRTPVSKAQHIDNRRTMLRSHPSGKKKQ